MGSESIIVKAPVEKTSGLPDIDYRSWQYVFNPPRLFAAVHELNKAAKNGDGLVLVDDDFVAVVLIDGKHEIRVPELFGREALYTFAKMVEIIADVLASSVFVAQHTDRVRRKLMSTPRIATPGPQGIQ